ncbi:hypothetical protein NIES2135_27060 [Leptolyngbya boryana NIES-2135]|jgi:hypothetical protein|uniref:Uncharacterized protein n=1 Tax=Leptolyngbya boryana NIES-2135 TaxID=1973484 RepID=A0A1Z4JGM8_LEPBY|nr:MULTISPECIES: hypothetical protein [Leptolyngbya]BAY55881.1 hypothetical protein NIES2135_27060 [Leptolyngbya boryana NIES-2135]MBD2368814.1 hypothetical protein [Leptolyngbya sp. FACHB-161]MBD2375318.1 hypothetical protein [Leptolyngbya sp. FACHB-238]MBD2399736.1 hypothetical protein [Leptolyngbya sp. FACHB-239]MBD2405942.1 hypothetical protein [Leptolyngbya sp. FACHB-402]
MNSKIFSIAASVALMLAGSVPSAIASSDVRCFVGRLNGDALCPKFDSNGQLKSTTRINRKGKRSVIRRQQPPARPLVLFKPMGSYRGNLNSNR